MARLKIPSSSVYPYHITARCNNREWFSNDLETVWSIFEDYLYQLHHFFGVRIMSFVLMPNHFHLMSGFPLNNRSSAMLYFMRETSRVMTRTCGRINHSYGGPFHRSLISDSRYFSACYKYVYRNPIRAGLSSRVEDYRFSTLHGLLGARKILIPTSEDLMLFDKHPEGVLKWLNTDFTQEQNISIARALKKQEFEIGEHKDRSQCLVDQIRNQIY